MRLRIALRAIVITACLLVVGLWLTGVILVVGNIRRHEAERYLEWREIRIGRSSEDSYEPYSVSTGDSTLHARDWNQIRLLGELRAISLAGDQCTSPEFLACLHRNRATLTELQIEDCQWSPQLAAAIGKCTNLEKLAFASVRDCEQRIQIPGLTKLSVVYIRPAKLRDENLRWLADQPALRELYLPPGEISGELVDTLIACRSLRDVYVWHASMSSVDFRRLISATNWESFTLPQVELGDSEIQAIAQSKLSKVDLRHLEVKGSLQPLLECPRITQLNISWEHYGVLASSGIHLQRKEKPHLVVLGLERYDDIPENRWPDDVELRRLGRYGLLTPEDDLVFGLTRSAAQPLANPATPFLPMGP